MSLYPSVPLQTAATTLIATLQQQVLHNPNKTLFVYLEDGETQECCLTYREFERQVQRIAALLQQWVSIGNRVLVILPPGLDYCTALFGCFYAGSIAVPVYPPDPKNLATSLSQIQAVATDTQPTVVLTVSVLDPILKSAIQSCPALSIAQWLCLDQLPQLFEKNWENPNLAPQELALLLYTSGSTGAPKGVMLNHSNLLYDAEIMAEGCGFRADDVMCIWLPPYHVSGLFSGVILPIYLGATNILFSPQQFVERPIRWLKAISRYKVTVTGAPTFAYALCSAAVKFEELVDVDLSTWRVGVVGGEAISPDILDSFVSRFSKLGFRREAFYPMFGQTECVMICTGGSPAKAPSLYAVDSRRLENRQVHLLSLVDKRTKYFIASGSPLKGMNIKIVNPDTRKISPSGEVGEIWVSGDNVAVGYWQRPEETAQTFQAFTTDTVQGPFLRTGDLGVIVNGELLVTGRLKEMIIIRGLNFYPDDIERTVLQSHPNLNHCSCVAFNLEVSNEEKLVIVIGYLEPPEESVAEDLIGSIRKVVAQQHGIQVHTCIMVPTTAIPRTRTGKLQRNACRKLFTDGSWKSFAYSIDLQKDASIFPSSDASLTQETILTLPKIERYARLTSYVQVQLSQITRQAVESIDLNRSLASLGIDSVMVVMLITALKDTLSVELPVQLFFTDITPTELIDLILQQLTQPTQPSLSAINFDAEAMLEPAIAPISDCKQSASSPKSILLTGVTGFLGRYLLRDLLKSTEAEIYCLVRSKSEAIAQQRLQQNFNQFDQWDACFDSRVHVIPGDLSQPQLGIAPNQFERLTAQVDSIYHNGATVNFVAPYDALKNVNVNSVKEVLKFACHSKLKSVHFTSTLAIFTSPERHQLPFIQEHDLLESPEDLFGGYAQSKWVAEKLLIKARKRGIPINIYRPGLVTGQSNTGYCNLDDFICRFIKGCLQLRSFPDIDFYLDLTPVDYVSQSIIYLSQSSKNINETFHLCNPNSIRFKEFLDLVSNFGYIFQRLPYKQWQDNLKQKITNENALYPLLPFLTERLTTQYLTFFEIFISSKNPTFSCQITQQALKPALITCPPINNALLNPFFSYLINCGFLPKPSLI